MNETSTSRRITYSGDYLIDTLKEHLAKVRGVSNVSFASEVRRENADRVFDDVSEYYGYLSISLFARIL